MVGGIANAATRSLVNGSDFGDNLMSALPDIIGQTIGGIIADGVAGSEDSHRAPRNQYAQNEQRDALGRPVDVRSDVEPIIVTGTRMTDAEKFAYDKAHHGFFWNLIHHPISTVFGRDSGARRSEARSNVSFNLGLSSAFRPSSRSEIDRAIRNGPTGGLFNASQPSTVRGWVLQQRLADSVGGLVTSNLGEGSIFDRYVSSPLEGGADFLNRHLFGPGTPLGTFNDGFYSITGLANNIDPGVIMTMESNGLTRVPGEVLSGIRGLNALRAATLAPSRLGAAPAVGTSELAISELTATHGLTLSRSEFLDLSTDIAANGIREPISYVRVGETNYIVDGHHRFAVAQGLGLTHVPAREVVLPFRGYQTTTDLFGH